MKRWFIVALCGFLVSNLTGCIAWSPDPTLRTEQLIMYSEQIRMSGQDLSRLLLLDQMSALNPQRIDGAVGP